MMKRHHLVLLIVSLGFLAGWYFLFFGSGKNWNEMQDFSKDDTEVRAERAKIAVMAEGLTAYKNLLADVDKAEASRIINTAGRVDKEGQYIREYIIEWPDKAEAATMKARLLDLSRRFPGAEVGKVRETIHDRYDYSRRYKIVKFVYARKKDVRRLVYDVDQFASYADKFGNLVDFHPPDEDRSENYDPGPQRFTALAALHWEKDAVAMTAAGVRPPATGPAGVPASAAE